MKNDSNNKIDVEICIDCTTLSTALASAHAAVEGGATRIECCARMDVGGLTPDLAIMQEIADAVGGKIEILAMIRPREGLFEYNRSEKMLMLGQAEAHIRIGVDGIVFGATENGMLDETLCEELAAYAGYHNVKSTFHRAFDTLLNPLEAMENIAGLGFSRVLTSGMPWGSTGTALEGIKTIQKYATHNRELEWVVGGGVSPTNTSEIVKELVGESLLSEANFSLHAYSSVLEKGITHAPKVASMVQLAQLRS